MEDQNQIEDLKKARKLIEKIRVAGLITHSPDEGLRGRPMSTAEIEEDGTIWYFTNEFSGKVDEISKDHEVFLSYASTADNSYVMVNGQAELVDDRSKMKQLWTPILKAWFPDGLDDPKLFLLKVKPAQIEYWDGASNKIVLALRVAKAVLSGEQYSDGENKKIVL